MASFKHAILLILLSIAIVACQKEELQQPSIIVEGWIEEGKAPIVLIHKSYVIDEDSKSRASLQSIIGGQMIVFGRVAIFDGADSIILTGRIDTSYMPPYIYTTTQIEGIAGKTYSLHAHYQGYDATAQTTIPSVARFDSIRAQEIAPGQMRLTGYMHGVKKDNYYMLMAKKLEAHQYRLCPLGVFSGAAANEGKMAVTIYCPDFSRIGIDIQKKDSVRPTTVMTFPKSEEQGYSIKLAQIDLESYLYWDQYAAQSMTQGVLFMSVYKNLPSNIQNGLGIWYGMGSSEYHLRLTQSKTFIF